MNTLSTPIISDAKLRKCPFCGCRPNLYQTNYGNYYLECICSCQYGFSRNFTEDEVIQRWNAWGGNKK